MDGVWSPVSVYVSSEYFEMNDQSFWCFIVGLHVDVDADVDDDVCMYIKWAS